MKRTAIRKVRKAPRPGRLKGDALEQLRWECWWRDAGKCKNCGRTTFPHLPHQHDASYHMAHIKAKRMGGDTLENVRTLCGQCHRKEHNYGKSMTKPVPKKEAA